MKNNLSGPASNVVYGCLNVVFFMVIITLSQVIMPWVWVLCICAFVISFIRIKRNLKSINNTTLNLLALFCMALLIYLSGNFGLMATMVNLLVVAACLKLMNLRGHGDCHSILTVLFFLIACGFVYHQGIYIVAYYFACLVLLFVTAFLLNKGSLSVASSVKQSSKMIMQALPIMMILFVVTPRLPPFWQTNVDKNTQTGLSEQITPGDIANLAQSKDLVFRAEFDSEVPSNQERYWRSIVLDHFDGKTWRTSSYHDVNISSKSVPQITQQALPSSDDIDSVMPSENLTQPQKFDEDQINLQEYRYLIVAQPNNTKWLYSLDIPMLEKNMGTFDINMTKQYQLFQDKISTQSSMYIVRSTTNSPLLNFSPNTDYERYLQIPQHNDKHSNIRTKTWVNENISSDMNFDEKVAKLNSFFTENPFAYTLQPPLMSSAPVDEFLFDYQQGFCSHYASAFTYMLRLSNIPARMVAGYQGGEKQGDNILTIRQYDAHAWVEAFDENKGWIRFDPTALVAPSRTLSGLLSALSAQDSIIFSNEMGGLFAHSMFNNIRETLALFDHTWHQFVLEFSTASQGSLIEDIFGELSKKNLATFLLLALLVIGLFLAFLFLPYKKWFSIKRASSVDRVFATLKKKGFERYRHEPLQTFFERIQGQLPSEIKAATAEFVECYYQYKYKADSTYSESTLLQLHSKIKRIKVAKTKMN